jgi:hypothetical protein
MYFADLSSYEYGREDPRPDVVNIGWLSVDFPVTKGKTSDAFLVRLRQLVQAPVNLYRGAHLCEFCPPPPVKVTEGGLRLIEPPPGTSGNGEIRVSDRSGITYVAPVLILHYVETHGYLPPLEFILAVESITTQEPNKTIEPTR